MIYTLEKQAEFGCGSMTSWWEVRKYARKTKIGVLVEPMLLFKGKKSECKKYIAENGIELTIEK